MNRGVAGKLQKILKFRDDFESVAEDLLLPLKST